MTNLCRFTRATIHTGDQPGPPSPYVGERRHIAKVSSGTSKFPMGNAQKQRAFESSNRKVNPIGGDGPIDVNWMGGKDNAESSCSRCRMGGNNENKGGSGHDYWRRPRTIRQYHIGAIWKIGRRGGGGWTPSYKGRAHWTSAWKNTGVGVLKGNVAWRTWHDCAQWRICLCISAPGLGL